MNYHLLSTQLGEQHYLLIESGELKGGERYFAPTVSCESIDNGVSLGTKYE